MNKIKEVFKSLDKTDLVIMKIGLKVSLGIMLISICILGINLLFLNTLFFYNLGLSIFKFSTYIAVEFIVCGLIADFVVKQAN